MKRAALSMECRLITQWFLESQMNRQFGEKVIQVKSGKVYIIPAGRAHAVAEGSYGTLVIIDSVA
jgi:quercetin dioxygenase-like cupin family protein